MDVLQWRWQLPIARASPSLPSVRSWQKLPLWGHHQRLAISTVQTGGTLRSQHAVMQAATPILGDGDTELERDEANEGQNLRRDDSETLERQQLFNSIAPVYDNLNDWLSLGLHRVWKRMTVSWSGAGEGHHVLDICCGSGDLAFLLAEKVGAKGEVTGLDYASEQLATAATRERQFARPRFASIRWIQADALDLPFEEGSFDAVTMGYGLRNVISISGSLAEIHRVLKPGSRAAILDFNRSSDHNTYSIQSWLLDNLVVPVATYFNAEQEYKYLKTSIARFPQGAEQENLARDAGFSGAVHYEVGGGLMGILVVTK